MAEPLESPTAGRGLGGNPNAGGDFAEALALSGQATQATAVLDDLAQRGARCASHLDTRRRRPSAGDTRAANGPGSDVELAFAREVELAEPAAPLERARTALDHGAFLRPTGRWRQARDRLHAAVTELDAVGAEGWARRARRELVSIGDRHRNRDPSLAENLTPQEVHGALLASDGATNNEIAGQLFLSGRTVSCT